MKACKKNANRKVTGIQFLVGTKTEIVEKEPGASQNHRTQSI